MSQTQALLTLLADGRPRSVPEIHRAIGPCRLNSRAAELRKRGVQIVCERTPGASGPEAYVYRIAGSLVGLNLAGGALDAGGGSDDPPSCVERPPSAEPHSSPDGRSDRSAPAVGEMAVSSSAASYGDLERAGAGQLSLLEAAA